MRFNCVKEVEVKILEINKQKVVDTLVKLNADKVFDDDILTIFLDFDDCQIHKRRDVLRLRQEGSNAELTYKEIKFSSTAKTAQEYTIKLSDLESTITILQKIGLSITQEMKKHRLSYKIGDVRFDIDRYVGEFGFIPEFLEIEGSTKEIKKYAGMLGFQEKDCLPWSTDELIAHYTKK
jgi:predicted adenylyl cyclase CyaB